MSEGIAIAIISGVATLAGTIVTVIAGMTRTSNKIEVSQAVLTEKLERLEQTVEKNNELSQRVPILEEKIRAIDCRLKEVEAR